MTTNNAPSLIAGHTGNNASGQYPGYYSFRAPMLLPDGRLIGQGYSSIVRLNGDGSFHSEFGTMPWKLGMESGQYTSFTQEGFQVQSDGKILIGGTWRTAAYQDASGFVLSRLNADGTQDKTFANGQGWSATNPGDREEIAGTLQARDGKVFIVGTAGTGSYLDQPNNFIAISRFNANGEVDLAFGDKGSVLIPEKNVNLAYARMQSDGKILAAGTHHNATGQFEAILFRLNQDGSLDATFGTAGKVAFDFHTTAFRIKDFAIQPDGKIVALSSAGYHSSTHALSNLGVTRFNPDGTLDTGFGTNGQAVIYPGAPLSQADRDNGNWATTSPDALLIRHDGTIVVAGRVELWANNKIAANQIAVAALRSNGELDPSFGTNGATWAPVVGTDRFHGIDVVEMRDGRLMLTASGSSFETLYRFNANGTIDLSFGTVGKETSNAISYKEGHPAVALNSGLFLHDEELAASTYQGASLQLQRHGGANAADVFEAAGKVSFAGGSVTIAGVVIGTITTGAGTLRIDFNAEANEKLVNLTLHDIAYRNTADLTESATVQIDWTFSDGSLTAQANTEVHLVAGHAPAWIEQLLDTRDAVALREALRAHLGPEQTLNIRYLSEGQAVPFTHTEQEQIGSLLSSVQAVSGIKLGTEETQGSNKLEIHSAAEIASGKFAFAALTNDGADLYIGKPASGTVDSMLPELNLHLLQTLGLGGASTATTNLDAKHIAALQYLYGPSSTARSGDDSYKLSELLQHFLWDGNGNDTIDGSSLSKDLTLHLEAGHWDFIGSKGPSITSAGQITVNFGSKFENANGGSGNDTLFGTTGANVLNGGAGNDLISGNGGGDTINGGDGMDTVNFAGQRADYIVYATPKGFNVRTKNSTESVTAVERLHFADGDKALDINGNAGQLFRLYQAIFNRKPDEAGLGYWLKAVDQGISMESVAVEFTKSPEFGKMYGTNVSNKELLTRIYEYALHRQPDNDGFAFWLNALDKQTASLGNVLIGFSESKENYAQVIGSMHNGIDYLAYLG